MTLAQRTRFVDLVGKSSDDTGDGDDNSQVICVDYPVLSCCKQARYFPFSYIKCYFFPVDNMHRISLPTFFFYFF